MRNEIFWNILSTVDAKKVDGLIGGIEAKKFRKDG